MDLNAAYTYNEEELMEFWTAFQDSWIDIYHCSLPVAAVINGHAIAGNFYFNYPVSFLTVSEVKLTYSKTAVNYYFYKMNQKKCSIKCTLLNKVLKYLSNSNVIWLSIKGGAIIPTTVDHTVMVDNPKYTIGVNEVSHTDVKIHF